MSDDQGAPSNNPRTQRRSSFAGQTFADIFGTGNRSDAPRTEGTNSPPQQGPITTAAVQAQRRRLSLATLGLSGSPDGNNRFGSFRGAHRDSIGSVNSSALDESAIEDDAAPLPNPGTSPGNTFGRRMSFGARALRDVRGGSISAGSGGTSPGQNGTRSPPASNFQPGHARAPSGTISSRDAKGRGLSLMLPYTLSLFPRHFFVRKGLSHVTS